MPQQSSCQVQAEQGGVCVMMLSAAWPVQKRLLTAPLSCTNTENEVLKLGTGFMICDPLKRYDWRCFDTWSYIQHAESAMLVVRCTREHMRLWRSRMTTYS